MGKIVEYSSNNSGGHWWLGDEDWEKLEKAGWKVGWYATDPWHQKQSPGEDRFLGALASSATREGLSERMAIAEWEDIVGQDSDESGCSCCGQPHNFYEREKEEEEESTHG